MSSVFSSHAPVTITSSSLSSFATPSTPASVSAIPGYSDPKECDPSIMGGLPDDKPACAIPNSYNNSSAFDLMYSCCQGQPIRSYGFSENMTASEDGSPCYLYCHSLHQTNGQLMDCLGMHEVSIACTGNSSSIGNGSVNTPEETTSTSASTSPSSTSSARPSQSSGGSVPTFISNDRPSRWGMGILVMLAAGSAAGMFL
ncbi:hypothetical protein EJ04DRAFT_517373 [Polyplosphaeria fusca]|uniref:Uncharacterized protein n=1 Tax=Polyplosphaeria fusca TaxID=682080 RepID=A0A9P4UVW1_9PLEO|nr:hypothetical protein EJ04DRAFT_517373 [Polyplosphaeria fusca]